MKYFISKIHSALFIALSFMFWFSPKLPANGTSPNNSAFNRFELKQDAGRWWLFSPGKERFVALGVVHLGIVYRGEQSLLRTRFGGDVEAANAYMLQLLKKMNCNSIGYNAPNELKPHLPYFAHYQALMISEWRIDSSRELKFADVFDPEVETKIREGMKRVCLENREDPNLIGYYWTDMPMWDLEHSERILGYHWVDYIRDLPAETPGKKAYIDFLLKRYEGNTEAMATRYEVQPERQIMLGHKFRRISRLDPIRQADDNAFLRLIARRYYSILGSETRKHDPHHLIFGDRYTNYVHPKAVIEEALPWIDALSIQPNGSFDKPYFDELYARTGKPINICDHQVSFPVDGFNRVIWPPADSKVIALEQMDSFIEDAFDEPYIIGYGRCQMIDHITGHGQSQRIKIGIIDTEGEPKSELSSRLGTSYKEVKQKLKL